MSQNIEEKLEKIVSNRNIYHTGTVVRINSFVVETTGLDDVFYFEKVYIGSDKNIGYVDKIESNKVYISIVKEEVPIKIGDNVISTKEPLMTYFSPECMGMIVDMFGNDKLSGKPFNNSRPIMIETPKIGIMERGPVNRPLETGIAAIDMLYPIGRGQRQLIIGDKKIGKTQIALDTICNQHDKDMICIYIAIGKTKKELKSVYTKLIERGANAYTIIVAAFNDDPVPVLKLTPYAGVSMAEEFLHEGKDVLVVIDDLKKHADACREISLIANKNTGRDAYPADIFYTHSRLLEKGCQHKNGGSITILPIIETKGNDITDYISTNVISITDGQIVLSPKLFEKGQKPSIDYGLSVSRLGSAVQKEEIVDVGATIRKTLLAYLETAEVYELVNEETMTPELKHQLKVGKRILTLLKQPKFTPLSAGDLVSRFEFIFTEEGDAEVNAIQAAKQEMKESLQNKKEEVVIPIADGLEDALNKEENKDTFTPVSDIAFEDVTTDNNVPTENITFEEITSPVVETPQTEEVIETPIVDAPVVETPQIEETVSEETPIVESPVAEEVVESPMVEEPIIESPVVDAPVVETPQTEEVIETPVVEEPIVENIPEVEVIDTPEDEFIPPVVEELKSEEDPTELMVEMQQEEEIIPEIQEEEMVVEETPIEENSEEEVSFEEVETPEVEDIPAVEEEPEEVIETPVEESLPDAEEEVELSFIEEVKEEVVPEVEEEIELPEIKPEEDEEEIELPATKLEVEDEEEIELPSIKVEEDEIELPTIKTDDEEDEIELPTLANSNKEE